MVGLSSGFSCVNLVVESFSSDLPKMGLYDLVCGVLEDNKLNGGWFLFC